MEAHEFCIAPNGGPYGPRIYIHCMADLEVKRMLAKECKWGGPDKRYMNAEGDWVSGYELTDLQHVTAVTSKLEDHGFKAGDIMVMFKEFSRY